MLRFLRALSDPTFRSQVGELLLAAPALQSLQPRKLSDGFRHPLPEVWCRFTRVRRPLFLQEHRRSTWAHLAALG